MHVNVRILPWWYKRSVRASQKPCLLVLHEPRRTQKAQYPLIEEYGLNYIGLHIMILKLYSLIKGYWALWGGMKPKAPKIPKP